jgi:ribosomal protein L11 methyltransferase
MADLYLQCKFNSQDDVVIALLSEYAFESFEETEDGATIAYIKADEIDTDTKLEIDALLNSHAVAFEWSELPSQNWNEIWETNFSPVEVEDICRIRADFHVPNPDFAHEILIQPKMAFGTGHHQTTYMMIKAMHSIDFKGKQVFDYGCGTGILAIFASMLGADKILAIDIEEESYLNTIENAQKNNVTNIETHCATLDNENLLSSYDVVLANINRNILLESCVKLHSTTKVGGTLLLSGILHQDEEIITSTFSNQGFVLADRFERDHWLCLAFKNNKK